MGYNISIEEKLPRVERLSIVPIRNVDDVYGIEGW